MKDLVKRWYRFLHPKFQTLHSEYPIDLKPRYIEQPHELLYQIIAAEDPVYSTWIEKILSHKEKFKAWSDAQDAVDDHSPSWNNGFFPALDMMAYYTLIADSKPQQIIEVGSGNSTKIARCAIKDNQLSTRLTSMDPAPRADIDSLSDQIIRAPFESVDHEQILSLSAGDILFIDNSHRVFPNSDAMVVFMEILPMLQTGVIVHIHDIYLPYDYPQFMCDRFYNEQYALAIAIMANPKRYRPILPCYHIHSDEGLSEKLSSIWAIPQLRNGEKHGGSFWLQIGD